MNTFLIIGAVFALLYETIYFVSTALLRQSVIYTYASTKKLEQHPLLGVLGLIYIVWTLVFLFTSFWPYMLTLIIMSIWGAFRMIKIKSDFENRKNYVSKNSLLLYEIFDHAVGIGLILLILREGVTK